MKMNLGDKIIELRKKENLTQEKLAEKIGISRQTLFNWENNSTSPDINQAKKISEIFKISLDDLLDIKTELQCSDNKSILSDLIGKECYLDADTEDYRLYFNTLCKIIDISDEFIKIEFEYNKKTITKLIDMKLISSIKHIEKDEVKK